MTRHTTDLDGLREMPTTYAPTDLDGLWGAPLHHTTDLDGPWEPLTIILQCSSALPTHLVPASLDGMPTFGCWSPSLDGTRTGRPPSSTYAPVRLPTLECVRPGGVHPRGIQLPSLDGSGVWLPRLCSQARPLTLADVVV